MGIRKGLMNLEKSIFIRCWESFRTRRWPSLGMLRVGGQGKFRINWISVGRLIIGILRL